jgi:tetratricopeptide (TPR) repeat protein
LILPRAATAAAILLLAGPTVAIAEGPCRSPDGRPLPAVAHLVSAEGEVTVNGNTPVGRLPFVAICPGDLVTVGSRSRAAVYLLEADTPLRLDENTVGRLALPSEPGSGTVELIRGALYFLSEVRRTLTIRTPYVSAGVEGTEVYLRVRHGAEAAAELLVLEGQVTVSPGTRTPGGFAPQLATTGERLTVDAAGRFRRSRLPGEGAYDALRRVTVGELSWTLFYPDVLAGAEASRFPRIAEAARLLAAGQADRAEALLDAVTDGGPEAGLRDALIATIAVARRDTATAQDLARKATADAPDAAAPLLALSYARQLALDLDGAFAAAAAAVRAAPANPLVHARLAELHLMRGETRAARAAAREAVARGGGPLADIVHGYAELAALAGVRAEAAFRRALAVESQNPLALLGLGLARIKQGQLETGREQIESAIVHDPGSSLLRSYLGKAYFEERRDAPAAKQLEIAKALDPADPTPWFYDAIRKQLANRPVEALRDLERSIELNENRAPFRSGLLLDEDRAVKGASLGRLYTDLGFTRLGINEAAHAATVEPADHAPHRVLADLYLADPRQETARLSELLQSQLLQPVGINPVQPSLAFSDLNTIAGSGPARMTFNEYSPAFLRDGWQVAANGLAGTKATLGDEVAATALFGRTSFSLGQFHYETDGFRPNNDLEHNAYDLFAQTALTESLNVQLEYLRRDSEFGDRSFEFDPDTFDPSERNKAQEDVLRAGAHLELAPGSDILASALYTDRERSLEFSDFDLTLKDQTQVNAHSVETQHVLRRGNVALVTGAGYSEEDNIFRLNICIDLNDCFNETFSLKSRGRAIYGYGTWDGPITLTAGLAYEAVDQKEEDFGRKNVAEWSPKLGFEWRPVSGLRLRAAALRSLQRSIQPTIEPTQIAGFNQLSDNFTGTKVEQAAIGADYRLAPDLTFGMEAIHRDITPIFTSVDVSGDTDQVLGRQTERAYRAFAYWTPTDRLAFSASLERNEFSQSEKEAFGQPSEIDTWLAPVQLGWFSPSGLFATGRLTFLDQAVERDDSFSEQRDGRNHAFVADAVVGYRFPGRRGLVSLEINNILDEGFNYQSDAFRSASVQVEGVRISSLPRPLFLPERTILLRIGINF